MNRINIGLNNGLVAVAQSNNLNDDAIKWQHFSRFVPVTGEFPAQRPVTRSFGVLFDLSLNKRLNKQIRGWWFETQSRPLWRQCNETIADIIDKPVK